MITEGALRHAIATSTVTSAIDDEGVPRAAVAIIARQNDGDVELLFIERATKDSDPWSGQMAFPGGRVDPVDIDLYDTARRETHEELGLDISGAECLGRIDDLEGGRAQRRRIIVSAHVWWIGNADPELHPNYEVADTIWVPSAVLTDPGSYEDFHWPSVPDQTFPSVRVGPGGKVIWGLTFRLLEDLFNRVGLDFPGCRPAG